MRGRPKPKKGKGLLAWRSRQKRGAIMKPSTFEEIKEKAKKRYNIGEERAKKVAGKAYWRTAKKKFKAMGKHHSGKAEHHESGWF